MTEGYVSLGTVGAVVAPADLAYSGFVYPTHKRVVPILSDGVGPDVSVLQEGTLGFREATLTLGGLSLAERDTLEGYDVSSETIEFVDQEGLVRDVRVLTFASSLRGGNAWEATVTLQELVPPGTGS